MTYGYFLNELNLDLNFKLETVGDEVNFMDVKVKVEDL